MNDTLKLKGKVKYQLLDALGKPLTREIWVPNGITTLAKNKLFDGFFSGGTEWTSWYAGLINNSGYTGVNSGDTITSHAGWTEFVDYKVPTNDTTSRATWGKGAASGGTITNAVQMTYTFTGSGSVAGIFIVSDVAKSSFDSAKLLWSTAIFSAALAVAADDELRVTYTVSA